MISAPRNEPSVLESGTGFRARCRVCSTVPCRWRVQTGYCQFEYFCERHESNKDMRLAAMSEDQPG